MSEIDENKQLICDLLLKTLQATRGGSKLVNLVYAVDSGRETVMAEFQGGLIKAADVTSDSGTALIFDVMRQIF